MKNGTVTFLRTAAGSPPIVSQFEYLRALGVRVVAGDCAPLSAGFYFADAAYVLPRVKEESYLDAVLDVCAKEGVDAFFPALDEELLLAAANREKFAAVGTRVVVSPVETIEQCVDKYKTYAAFTEFGIPRIPTFLAEEFQPDAGTVYPMVIKPRIGRGSTDVFVVHNARELLFFKEYIADAIVQPFISGMEYTVDVLADEDSETRIISPRKRLATDSGISSKGCTAWHEEMVYWTKEIVTKFHIVGPANIQCFLTEAGQLHFCEINARLAGTCMLSVAAGVPLFEGLVDMARGNPIRECLQPVPETIMLRYWAEKIIRADELAETSR